MKHPMTELERIKTASANTNMKPLDPTYDRVLENICKQLENCVELAFKVLSWLVKAKRLLKTDEIRVAVSVELNRYELDYEMDLPDTVTLLEVCAGLVVIDEGTNTIRLSHYTVQEYLGRKSVLPQDAESKLAMACTTYLSFDTYPQAFGAGWKSIPFLTYAADHLPFHLKVCDESLTTDMVMILLSPERHFTYGRIINNRRFRLRSSLLDQRHPLRLACSIGRSTAVERLLADGAKVWIWW